MKLDFHEEDWARIERDWGAFWAGELARPIVMMQVFKPGGPELFDAWTRFIPVHLATHSVDEILDREQEKLEHLEWCGDTFPKWAPNLGPGIVAGFLGAEVHGVADTVWFSSGPDTPISDLEVAIAPGNRWWRLAQEFSARAAQRWAGQVCVGYTDLGGNLDILASLVTTQQLLLDCVDEPEHVARLANDITAIWLDCYDALDPVVSACGRGSTNWAPLWSPQRFYMLQSDFSYMISPAMFERFVLPDLERCCAAIDYPFYHMDGKGQLRHLDYLLGIKPLRGIQWQPGAGTPATENWLPLLKRIRDAGKLCQVYVTPEWAETIVRVLGGRGFVLAIEPPFLSRAEAEDFLRHLAQVES
ncbi:MAG: hypothetical protein IPK16_09110 [Anaerolineales bacterium]|nr:hypothetical protein [Anaerolineales bacterium]